MAGNGKDYTVSLDVDASKAIASIDETLKRVQALNTSIADIDGTEVAFNVVVRNVGFQNMIATVNRTLSSLEDQMKKSGSKIGDNIAEGVDSAGDKIAKADSGFKKAAKEIANEIKAQVEGSLKGLDKALNDTSMTISRSLGEAFSKVGTQIEDTIANSVTKGMAKGLRGITAGATETFNAQALTFKTNFDDLDAGLDRIKDLSNDIGGFKASLEQLKDALAGVRDILGGGNAHALRDMAKGLAGKFAEREWSENHMSLKDRRHADVEDRRVAMEERRLLMEEDDHGFNQELARLKAENEERREGIRLTEEQKRAEKKNNAEMKSIQSQQRLYDTEQERSAKKLADEDEKRDMLKQRRAEQMVNIRKYAAREANRDRIEETDLEKALFNWEKASLRVKQQIASTQRNLQVDESAMAQAAKDKKDTEILVNKELLRQVTRYKEIKDNAEATTKSLQKAATALQRWSSAVSSIGGVLSTFRQLSTTMASAINKAGSTFLGYARQAASSIASAATEQYRQLELAQIGFTNFYGADQATDLIKQIKEQAMISPGVDAGDLASYVRQLAPVSNGNAQQALDAAMGMLKTIQYGGGEASEEMEYVIKNIRDVISKGTATSIDLRQFNRAMPIMEDVLESIGKSDFIKNGQLKIDKNNAKDLLQAFADINNDPNSPVVDIFDQMSNTLSGIQDVIKQTFITRFNDTLIDLGFYDKVKKILQDFYNSGAIEKFYKFLANTANRILDFISSLDWDAISKSGIEAATNIWQSIKDVAKQIMATLGATDLASLIKKVGDIIGSFVRGFGDGVNKILEIINWAEQNIGPDVLAKAANFMGLLASPLGQLLQSTLSIVQNVLNFGSRVLYNTAAKVQTKAETRLANLDQFIDAPSSQITYKNTLWSLKHNHQFKDASISKALGNTVLEGGDVRKGNYWYYDKEAGNYGTLRGVNTRLKTTTGLNEMKFSERMAAIGDGSMLKGMARTASSTVKNVAGKLKTAAGKMVKAFAYYEIGKGISAVAGEIATAATGDPNVGKTVQQLGNVASAAIALGSQFGLLGAAAGIAIEGLKQFHDAAKEMKEAAVSYAEKMRNAMYEQSAKSIMEKLIAGFSGIGKYTAGDEIDADAQAKMYDNIIANLRDNPTKSLEEVIKEAEETYLTTRATSIARRDLTTDTANVDLGVTKTTDLSDKTDRSKLYAAFYKLRDMGLIVNDLENWATTAYGAAQVGKWKYAGHENDDDYVPTDDDILKNLSVTEIINYLKANGLSLSSEEALTKFLEIADDKLTDFLENKNYDAEMVFKIASGDQTYNSWEEMLTAAGFVRDSQYGWVLKAQLILTQNADKEANKSIFDRQMEDVAQKAASGNILGGFIQNMASPFIGLYSWLTGLAHGGPVKPIYRAGGGDARGVDTVPAMLQPGEFVMRQAAVNKVGMGVLNALNYGDLGKAAQLLGARFSGNWNNSRSYNRNSTTVNKYQTNHIQVSNRTNGGRLNSYNALANRLAVGF